MDTITAAELTKIFTDFGVQLSDIVSFLLGGITGFAFVITANFRWL